MDEWSNVYTSLQANITARLILHSFATLVLLIFFFEISEPMSHFDYFAVITQQRVFETANIISSLSYVFKMMHGF